MYAPASPDVVSVAALHEAFAYVNYLNESVQGLIRGMQPLEKRLAALEFHVRALTTQVVARTGFADDPGRGGRAGLGIDNEPSTSTVSASPAAWNAAQQQIDLIESLDAAEAMATWLAAWHAVAPQESSPTRAGVGVPSAEQASAGSGPSAATPETPRVSLESPGPAAAAAAPHARSATWRTGRAAPRRGRGPMSAEPLKCSEV